MELVTQVSSLAEAILKLTQAGELTGSSLRIKGTERPILVSTVRQSVGNNLNEQDCYNLADFTPLAFGRIALSHTGVKISEHYGRRDSRGRIREYRRLDEQPVYKVALRLATEWQMSRPEDVAVVAEWSGMIDLVRRARR